MLRQRLKQVQVRSKVQGPYLMGQKILQSVAPLLLLGGRCDQFQWCPEVVFYNLLIVYLVMI